MKSSLPGHSRLDFTAFDCYYLKWKEKSGPVIPGTLLVFPFPGRELRDRNTMVEFLFICNFCTSA